jgi:hypothetical protein
MATRRRNPRQAKRLRCYTLAETADLYSVHRNTVRLWQANGLQPIDGGRPAMFHGSELNRFHKQRRLAGRQTCGDGEVFCLSCRAPRRPALGIADYTPVNSKVGTLSAICPDCDRLMTQRVNAARLARFSASVEVTTRPAPEPLVDRA